jgi:hypothetical protein
MPAQNLRFTEDEAKLYDALQAHLGVASRAEMFRIAVRELARNRGLLVETRYESAVPFRMQAKPR